jgi:hypothetical protein
MSPLYLYNNELLVIGGKLAANEECCCVEEPPCSGPCDAETPCPEGCECVDGECVALGTCCQQGCTECTSANYIWDGEKWALSQCFSVECPTTECQVTDCPAVASPENPDTPFSDPPTQESIDSGSTLILSIRWCCLFPDSQYTCFQSTQTQCSEVFQEWTEGEQCGADPQTYCNGKFNPLP